MKLKLDEHVGFDVVDVEVPNILMQKVDSTFEAQPAERWIRGGCEVGWRVDAARPRASNDIPLEKGVFHIPQSRVQPICK